MMSNRISVLLVSGLLVVTTPALAQIAMPMHVIPVVAKTAGVAGTDWRSDLAIANLGTSGVPVGLAFFREATEQTLPTAFPVLLTLEAGETRTVEDVLGTLFPAEGNTKGALLVFGIPNPFLPDEDIRLTVASRTYNNANPEATYGQGVGSGLVGASYGHGASVLTGVRHDQRFRSNIGVVNMGPQPLEVLVATFDPAGGLVSEAARTVESFSLRQWNLGELGAAGVIGGRTEIRVEPDSITWDPCSAGDELGEIPGLFLAYLSKVDQATGDAEFHLGQVDWSGYVDVCGEDPGDPVHP